MKSHWDDGGEETRMMPASGQRHTCSAILAQPSHSVSSAVLCCAATALASVCNSSQALPRPAQLIQYMLSHLPLTGDHNL